MDDLTITVCNHDTPELIYNWHYSLKKVMPNFSNILVVDTGKYPLLGSHGRFDEIYIPNTSHGNAVNKIFQSINTKYIILTDSDVLFLQDITKPFQKFKEGGFVLMGEVVGDRGGKSLHPRVNPWFCFMDLEQLKHHNIQFYDHHRTKEIKSEKIYDIGSTMYEDVLNAGLTIANAKMEGKYFKHYEGMSWRVQKYDPNQPDTDIDVGGTHNNKALYLHGLMVKEQYERDVANL